MLAVASRGTVPDRCLGAWSVGAQGGLFELRRGTGRRCGAGRLLPRWVGGDRSFAVMRCRTDVQRRASSRNSGARGQSRSGRANAVSVAPEAMRRTACREHVGPRGGAPDRRTRRIVPHALPVPASNVEKLPSLSPANARPHAVDMAQPSLSSSTGTPISNR
jgi:hypothetical protein